MKSRLQRFIKAKTENEAVNILSEEDSAQVVAGGTDMMLRLNRGFCTSDCLIDIRTGGMSYIREDVEDTHIGATTTVTQLLHSDLIKERHPALYRSAASFASTQIRNMATVGGNIGNASPAADLVPALIVSGAEVTLKSRSGVRQIPLAELFTGPGKTVIQSDELISSVKIRSRKAQRFYENFEKLGFRKAQVIAVVNFAIGVIIKDGRLDDVSICYGSVGPTPMVGHNIQKFLIGQTLSEDVIREAVLLVSKDISPIDDIRAGKNYRQAVAAGYLYRNLLSICE